MAAKKTQQSHIFSVEFERADFFRKFSVEYYVSVLILKNDNLFNFCLQSFRLEFSVQGGCYDFLVRDKDRCEKFLKVFTSKLSFFKL